LDNKVVNIIDARCNYEVHDKWGFLISAQNEGTMRNNMQILHYI